MDSIRRGVFSSVALRIFAFAMLAYTYVRSALRKNKSGTIAWKYQRECSIVVSYSSTKCQAKGAYCSE